MMFIQKIKNIIENKQKYLGLIKTVGAALVAHGHSVSVGLCQGYSAVLLPQLAAPTTDLNAISPEQASWIAALGVISNPVGALLGGALADSLGRRTTLLAAALPYVAGWLLIGFAPDLAWLGAGRFVTGLAVGMGSVSYVYVAEVSGPTQRGTLAACGPVLVSLGVLAVYALGAAMHWRLVALLAAAVALVTGLMAFMLPETPPWLASRGKLRKANDALTWLRHSREEAQLELNKLQLDKTDDSLPRSRFLTSALEPAVWKPFFILLAFFLFQEGSGIYVILFYAVDFFREVGSSVDESMASVSVGAARLIMSIVGAVLLGRFGRRTLAIFSATTMAIIMSVTAGYEFTFLNTVTEMRPLAWMPAICVMLHVCASMTGTLQLPWIMTSELFPIRVRSIACGLVTAAAHLLIFASVKTYPSLVHFVGMPTTLVLFTSASVCGAIFAYFILPETKGKTLIEIENDFKKCNTLENIQACNNDIFTIIDDSPIKKTNYLNV